MAIYTYYIPAKTSQLVFTATQEMKAFYPSQSSTEQQARYVRLVLSNYRHSPTSVYMVSSPAEQQLLSMSLLLDKVPIIESWVPPGERYPLMGGTPWCEALYAIESWVPPDGRLLYVIESLVPPDGRLLYVIETWIPLMRSSYVSLTPPDERLLYLSLSHGYPLMEGSYMSLSHEYPLMGGSYMSLTPPDERLLFVIVLGTPWWEALICHWVMAIPWWEALICHWHPLMRGSYLS